MKRLSRQDFLAIVKNRIEGDRPFLYETDYYLGYFDQLGERSRLIRWNWSAFFWDGAWMFYRRMFVYGTAVLILNTLFLYYLIEFLTKPEEGQWGILLGSYLLMKFLLGIFGNVFYLTFIRRSLAQGRVPGLVEGSVLWAYFGLVAILFIAGVL